jgi:hypothetical protein
MKKILYALTLAAYASAACACALIFMAAMTAAFVMIGGA